MNPKAYGLSPTAVALSFALHTAALAAALIPAWRKPVVPLSMVAVEVVVTAPGENADQRSESPDRGAAQGTKSAGAADQPTPSTDATWVTDFLAVKLAVEALVEDDSDAVAGSNFEAVQAPADTESGDAEERSDAIDEPVAAVSEAATEEVVGDYTVAEAVPVTDHDVALLEPPRTPERASIGSDAKVEGIAVPPPGTEAATAPPFDPVKAPPGLAARTAVPAPIGPSAVETGPEATIGLTPVAAAPGNPRPRYPFVARGKGLEGRVVLRVAVLPSGAAASVTVEESSGYRILDRAALKTVKRWRFVPATRFGQPIEAVVRVPVTFKLVE